MIGDVTQARNAYARTLQGLDATAPVDNGTADGTGSFGSMLKQAVSDAITTGHDAEKQAAQGIQGGGDMTQIVTAVSNAQLALQTTTALRDRFVQAYQDVMRMSI